MNQDVIASDQSRKPANGNNERKARIVVALLVILAALFSVLLFSWQSLRLDEAQSLWQTSRTPLKILNIIAQDVHVPLYHMLLHFWQTIFGNGVYMARVFSLIFFLLSIPAIYRLGKLAFGTKEGLFAALLLTISPFMNWYGNEIRMYSLFTFLIIVNQYYFLRLYKDPENSPKGRLWFYYGLTALLGIYTHYFFFFSLATQAIFYVVNKHLFDRDSLKKFIGTAFVLILAFLPWVLYVYHLGTANNSSPLLSPPTSVSVFNTFSQFLFGFQVDYINTILVSLWPLAVLLGFMALRKHKVASADTLYFVGALVIPIILAFILSTFIRPVYLSRYLILTLPPLYLLLGWLASTYPRQIEWGFKTIIVIAMLISLSMEVVSAKTPVKENYREAAEYLSEHAIASDVIVVSAPFTIYPIEYYYNGPATITTLPIWNRFEYGPIPPFDAENLPAEVEAIKEGHTNLWLLQSYDQGYEEDIRRYFDNNYHRLVIKNFSRGLNLYEYKIRYP